MFCQFCAVNLCPKKYIKKKKKKSHLSVLAHQVFPHADLTQKSSSRLFPLSYFFILVKRASCYLRRYILQMPSRAVEIYLGTTVPISLVRRPKLIHVAWRYPTHIAYQMEAECQVLKLSPKLIVSLSNSTHTLYHKLMKRSTASLQKPEFSSLRTYRSII